MSRMEAVSAWEQTVSSYLPSLSKPQARVLALWSYGVVLAQRCGQTSVAATVALLLGQREGTVRQRLREWLYAATDKRGRQRRAVEVETCFAPLLGWVLRWWEPAKPSPPPARVRRSRRAPPPAPPRHLALALDATALGERFVVLAVAVLYRRCAIPVAWAVVPANQPGAWRPHWERLLAQLHASVPGGPRAGGWSVLVLADRGLYAPWLFGAIVRLGWHPGLRVNGGAGCGHFRVVGRRTWRPLSALLLRPGTCWAGRVDCFRARPIRATLVARWEPGYDEAWLVVTDLPPQHAKVAWYGLRAWVECGFKDLKRDGWQWQRTRMTAPERAARFWLVLAVATLWVVSVGSAAEDALLPAVPLPTSRPTRRLSARSLSCFRRGVLAVLTTLIKGDPLPTARFVPEPWPTQVGHKTYP